MIIPFITLRLHPFWLYELVYRQLRGIEWVWLVQWTLLFVDKMAINYNLNYLWWPTQPPEIPFFDHAWIQIRYTKSAGQALNKCTVSRLLIHGKENKVKCITFKLRINQYLRTPWLNLLNKEPDVFCVVLGPGATFFLKVYYYWALSADHRWQRRRCGQVV